MRNTTTTVTFDFTFKYPRHGIYEEANSVTVCEPNYDKRQVYITMKGYMGEVQNGLMKLYSDPGIASQVAQARERLAAGVQDVQATGAETDDDEGPSLLEQMQRVMGVEGYARVYDYLQKQLTNCKQLAFVGSDPDDKNPIVEEVWAAIAREGGMPAIDRILGAFANFFLAPSSKSTTSGMSGSTSPSPPLPSPTAGSKSRKRSDSPSHD